MNKKYAVLFTALALFLLIPIGRTNAMGFDPQPTGTITLVSPNGGEVYKAGQQITVVWTSQGLPSTATVLIDIEEDGVDGTNMTIGNVGFPVSRGQESYVTIPSNITAGNYYMTIYAIDPSLTGEVGDHSAGDFTVTSASQVSATPTPVPVSVKATSSTTVVHTQPTVSNNSNVTTTSTTSATIPLQNTQVTVSFWQSIKNFFANLF